jgi:hypothetical protein
LRFPRFFAVAISTPGCEFPRRMETITLQQLQEMFAGLHSETDWNLDGEMLWGYYFTAAAPEVLEALAEKLEARDIDVVEIFESDDDPVFILEAQRIEKHTPETLFARNGELEALAGQFEGVEYDGMDVNPVLDGDEDEEGCCCHEESVGGCGCGGEGGCEGKCEGGEEEGHQCGCGSSHYHGENEPIENPELLTAIETIANDKSEDAQYALTLALQRGLYLVPAFAGRLDADQSDDEALQVLVCTDENDAEYLPLFTDEAALKAWTSEDVSAMVLTAPEAWDFILTRPECSGGVINPGDKALPLNREMVALLKKMIDESKAASGQE